jgi:hypothetical protein
MIWLALMLLLVPFLSLPEIVKDKEQLASRCNIILNPNANQTQRDYLRQGLSVEEAAYIAGYCAGLKINDGITNATNGTLPIM